MLTSVSFTIHHFSIRKIDKHDSVYLVGRVNCWCVGLKTDIEQYVWPVIDMLDISSKNFRQKYASKHTTLFFACAVLLACWGKALKVKSATFFHWKILCKNMPCNSISFLWNLSDILGWFVKFTNMTPTFPICYQHITNISNMLPTCHQHFQLALYIWHKCRSSTFIVCLGSFLRLCRLACE